MSSGCWCETLVYKTAAAAAAGQRKSLGHKFTMPVAGQPLPSRGASLAMATCLLLAFPEMIFFAGRSSSKSDSSPIFVARREVWPEVASGVDNHQHNFVNCFGRNERG